MKLLKNDHVIALDKKHKHRYEIYLPISILSTISEVLGATRLIRYWQKMTNLVTESSILPLGQISKEDHGQPPQFVLVGVGHLGDLHHSCLR